MAELLTAEEFHAIELTQQLAMSLQKIVSRDSSDWIEALTVLHQIQNMVMSQAAARAYPQLFRLLGKPPNDEPKTITFRGRD